MGYTEKFTDHPLPRHTSVTHKFQPAAFYESKKKFFLATGFCHINCYAQSGACLSCTLPLYVTRGTQGTVAFESPHIRESKTVLDPEFHAVDSGFQVLDYGFLGRGTWIQESSGQ